MFSFDMTQLLRKKLSKLAKKDKILAQIFKRKLIEVINNDSESIDRYKNLKSPMQEYKRIHLTDNFILLFIVKDNKIIFADIAHRDYVYKN